MITTNIVAALATALTGLALLFASWRRRLPGRWLPVPVGWGLLVLSGWFWVAATGTEFGISLVLMATSALAWLFVVANRQQRVQQRAQQRAHRVRGEPGPPKPVADGRSLARHVVLFLLVVPLAAAASALAAVAVSLALPVSEIDAMVTVLVVMPVLWGCAAYWAVADSRIARPAAAMVLSAAVSAAVIYV